jgi:hypothetical protein
MTARVRIDDEPEYNVQTETDKNVYTWADFEKLLSDGQATMVDTMVIPAMV